MCSMRVFMILALSVFGALYISVPLAHAQHEAAFFSTLSDMPMMPGLTEDLEESFSFDKPEGTITHVRARLNAGDLQRVRAFYKATLPQMGWSLIGTSRYARADEILDITFEGAHVVFMVRPSGL